MKHNRFRKLNNHFQNDCNSTHPFTPIRVLQTSRRLAQQSKLRMVLLTVWLTTVELRWPSPTVEHWPTIASFNCQTVLSTTAFSDYQTSTYDDRILQPPITDALVSLLLSSSQPFLATGLEAHTALLAYARWHLAYNMGKPASSLYARRNGRRGEDATIYSQRAIREKAKTQPVTLPSSQRC